VALYSPVWGAEQWSILGALIETTESDAYQLLLVGLMFFVLPALVASGVAVRLLWGTYPSSTRLPVNAILSIAVLAIASTCLGALVSYALWPT